MWKALSSMRTPPFRCTCGVMFVSDRLSDPSLPCRSVHLFAPPRKRATFTTGLFSQTRMDAMGCVWKGVYGHDYMMVARVPSPGRPSQHRASSVSFMFKDCSIGAGFVGHMILTRECVSVTVTEEDARGR